MGTREEALRRILEATAAARNLSEDERRELLAHLEDSVEDRVRAGTPEAQAIAQALEEMGNLEAIARQFRAVRPVAVTPEGQTLPVRVASLAAACALLTFCAVQLMVTPRFAMIFDQVDVPLPAMSVFFLGLSSLMRECTWFIVLALPFAGWGLLRLGRSRQWRALAVAASIASITFFMALVLALGLPLLSLLRALSP